MVAPLAAFRAMTDDEAVTGPPPDRLLWAHEVAVMFDVDPRTVARWARQGRLPPAVVTPGGHRRWSARAVAAALARGVPADLAPVK